MIKNESRSKKLKSFFVGKYPFYFDFKEGAPNGCSGHYFRHPYNRTIGVKVFGGTKITKEQDARNLLLRVQGVYEDIIWEAAFINSFYKKRIAVVRFCYENKTQDKYLGIVMPHFSGKHPYNILNVFYCPKKDRCFLRSGRGRIPLVTAINLRAFDVGIHLSDVHEQNVVIDHQGKPWAIDFGAHGVQQFRNFNSMAKEFHWVLKDFKQHYKESVENR